MPWRAAGEERHPTNEEIAVGSLQRIADATEVMAQNYVQLQKDREWYIQAYNNSQSRIKDLEYKIRTMKGHLTRLKLKLSAPATAIPNTLPQPNL